MKRRAEPVPDPDDMFADTRMSFGEHIEDLRTHLLRAIYGFLIAFVIAIPIGKPLLRFIAAPVENELDKYEERYNVVISNRLKEEAGQGKFKNLPPIRTTVRLDAKELAKAVAKEFGFPQRDDPEVLNGMMRGIIDFLEQLGVDHVIEPKYLQDASYIDLNAVISNPLDLGEKLNRLKPILRPARLTTLSIQEAFVVLVKVILMAGLVLASPWVFYQIWSFVAAGLYPHEKRLVNVYGPFSVVLFLSGVFVCEFFVIPKAIEAMLWFNELLGFQPDLRLNEWLGFAIFMPIVFGISFQTPLVMLFMEKIGLFTIESYRNKRRLSWFLMAIFAAVITPSTDALSMMFLWVPMSLLYELGILLCLLSPRETAPDWETSESEELVEV
ncbi:MAG: preprotein translocase subunit TatC [Planctomycetes bacterium]|nr:preprotein translocase subunit TatC [Planctomycetota bacterium]